MRYIFTSKRVRLNHFQEKLIFLGGGNILSKRPDNSNMLICAKDAKLVPLCHTDEDEIMNCYS